MILIWKRAKSGGVLYVKPVRIMIGQHTKLKYDTLMVFGTEETRQQLQYLMQSVDLNR